MRRSPQLAKAAHITGPPSAAFLYASKAEKSHTARRHYTTEPLRSSERLVHGGLLDRYLAQNELTIAGEMGGLEQDEALRHILSAFERAKDNPAKIQLRLIEVVA